MIYDYVIVGAGPGGLQLGYFFEELGRNYLIVEGSEHVGNFFYKFPRHRKLISINKVNTGFKDQEINYRWDWNSLINKDLSFTSYADGYFPVADNMCLYLKDFSEKHRLNIRLGFKVENISKDKQGFHIRSEGDDLLLAKRIIVATGMSKPFVPNIPGVELADNYTVCSVNPQDFKGKRVLVIGKGNSALETAENLIETTSSIHLCSPNPVKLAWETHFVGNIRAVNNNFLDTYQLKSQNVILDANIERLERREDQKIYAHIQYTHAKGERRIIPFDHVILATGFRVDVSIFDECCQPALSFEGKLPELTAEWESTNIPHLYFAGTLMQMRDYKKTMSGFIHGFRYNIQSLSHILNARYHGVSWPEKALEPSPLNVAEVVIDRLNRSSSIFLQPGYFCDLILDQQNGRVSYIEDVPADYVKESRFAAERSFFTVSLEYGDYSNVADPFNILRDPDPKMAHTIEYLHPILRKYQAGVLINEHHLVEDVENDYSAKHYLASVAEYLRSETSLSAHRG